MAFMPMSHQRQRLESKITGNCALLFFLLFFIYIFKKRIKRNTNSSIHLITSVGRTDYQQKKKKKKKLLSAELQNQTEKNNSFGERENLERSERREYLASNWEEESYNSFGHFGIFIFISYHIEVKDCRNVTFIIFSQYFYNKL